jgi:hypothetical protein
MFIDFETERFLNSVGMSYLIAVYAVPKELEDFVIIVL